jgi:hypothetical protein
MEWLILTVSRFEVAREFYRKLLPEFGMKPVFDGDGFFYCIGARTAIGIAPCDPALVGERFVQQRVGLHHLCLRARSREENRELEPERVPIPTARTAASRFEGL